VAAEWHIYLLFPLILWLRRKCGLFVTTASGFVLSLAISSIAQRGLLWPTIAPLAGCFVLGVAAREIAVRGGRLRDLDSRTPPWGIITAIGIAALIAYVEERGAVVAARDNRPIEAIVGLTMAAALVGLTTHGGRLNTLLSSKFVENIGVRSYSLYLIHAPVVQLVWLFLRRTGAPDARGAGLAVLLGLALPLVLVLTWIFHAVVERRCLPDSMRKAIQLEVSG